jgi:hypothetical protein
MPRNIESTHRAIASITARLASGHQAAILAMYAGWVKYAIGRALVHLLNGETGNLDCGTIDGEVRRLMVANGITPAAADEV